MDNIIKEGEQMMEGGNNNQSQGNDNQSSNFDQSSNNNNQSSNDQQSSGNSSGGGFMSGMKQNTEDAYINNEANSFLTKEGMPSAADGAIDGVVDTEFNKYSKDL